MSKLHIVGKIAECESSLPDSTSERQAALFRKAFAFLKRNDLAELPPGKHEIDGDRCWANVIDATLKPLDECKLEAHRRYIDIQAPVTGPETIGIADMDDAARSLPFDEENDYVLTGITLGKNASCLECGTGRDSYEDTLGYCESPAFFKGILVIDRDDFVIDLCIESIRNEACTDSLDLVRTCSSL